MKKKRKTTQRERKRKKRDNLSLHKKVKPLHKELPFYYGKTKICLMVVDPYWLHAYWEITPETIKPIKTKIGEGWENVKYILRVYDVKYIDFDDTNANYWFDIEVRKEDTNWYINLWNDNSSYYAEIGILTREGDFFSFARSNFVQTPGANISNNLEERWMDVRGDYHISILLEEPVYDKLNEERALVEDSYLARGQERVKESPLLHEGTPLRSGVKSHKTDQNVKEGSSLHEDTPIVLIFQEEDEFQTPEVEIMSKEIHPIQPSNRSINKKKNTPILTKDDIRAYYEEKWSLYEKGYKSGEFGTARQKDGSTKGESLSASKREADSGASEGKGRSQILRNKIKESGLSSDFFSSFSGRGIEVEKGKKGRGFFFVLDKEIIIYGRTESDAEVWLSDKKVELQKDGSFTLRYALPDEKISFPFTAVSSDGKERRSIRIEVETKVL